jgi:argininosuccinate synthase
MAEKGILAFSGGLDTSVVIKYLQEEYNMDVITVTVDVGQGDDQKKIEAKAKKLGVIKHYNIDARKEFVENFIFPSIKANALYQKKYCLATALARPLIAEKVLEIAKKEKVTALAHGCSGKGNDQVRFDITLRSGSDLPIIAPIRDKNLDRVTELEFAKKHGIEIDSVAKKFSIDQNLWGRAIEGGVLEDPYNEPPEDAFIWVKTKNLPDKPTYLEIKFEKGIPVAVDGKILEPIKLIEYVNKKAGDAGVGIVDHIEDRVVGIKSREVYETPGALCFIEAHSDLEKMVHTKHENKFKSIIDDEWTYLAYSGLWQDPLKQDLDAFIQASQKPVSGTVKLKLFKGSIRVVGRKSDYSLYSHKIATYGTESTFDQRLAK